MYGTKECTGGCTRYQKYSTGLDYITHSELKAHSAIQCTASVNNKAPTGYSAWTECDLLKLSGGAAECPGSTRFGRGAEGVKPPDFRLLGT